MVKRLPFLGGLSLCLALLACEQPEVVPFAETDSWEPVADAASGPEDGGGYSGTDSDADASTDGGAHSSDASSDSGASSAELTQAREICRAGCASVEHLPCYSESCVDVCLMLRESVPACAGFADGLQLCKAMLGEQDSACDAEGAIVRTTEKCQAELNEWQACFVSQG